jgi:hypothetical protein
MKTKIPLMSFKGFLRRISVCFIAVAVIVPVVAFSSCSGDGFEDYKKARQGNDNPPLPDTSAPTVKSINVISESTIEVTFNEPLDQTTAETYSNYHIQGNNRVEVLAAPVPPVLSSDKTTVTLKVSTGIVNGMQHGKEYTLLVQRVKDLNGNAVLTDFSKFIGRGKVYAEIWYNSALMPTESPFPNIAQTNYTFTVKGLNVVSYMYKIDNDPWSTAFDIATPDIAYSFTTQGVHVLKVIGKNTDGIWQDANNATTAMWTIDTMAPLATLDHVPLAVTDVADINITVKGVGVTTYVYRLNEEPWSNREAVTTSIKRKGLVDGTYTVYVKGADDAGNDQLADTTYSWKVVTDKPIAVLSGLPAKSTRSRAIGIGVSGTGVNFYKYSIDGTWSTLRSVSDPITGSYLVEGAHSLSVIGYRTSDPATAGDQIDYSWTVDFTPPVCRITNTPDNPSHEQDTYIIVTQPVDLPAVPAPGDVIVAYKYRLNIGSIVGSFSEVYDVSTPIHLTSLGENVYTIDVIGIDAAGNEQNLAIATSHTWRVDVSPPIAVLTGVPSAITNVNNYSITVGGSDVVAYKYLIDGGSWIYVSNPTFSLPLPNISDINVADGLHTISVVAMDTAGNWQSMQAPTEYSWTIDTQPPVAELGDKPPTTTSSFDINLTVGGIGLVRYQYRLDGGAWSAEINRIESGALTKISATGLALGSHTVDVIGIDLAGNKQSTAVGQATTYTWTIDTSMPSAALDGAPLSFTNIDSTDITVRSSSCVLYKYQLDNSGTWVGSLDPTVDHIVLSGLTQGAHNLKVIGRNAGGTWQGVDVATELNWTIDKEKPDAVVSAALPLPEKYTGTQIDMSVNSAVFTVSGNGVVQFRVAHRDNTTGFTQPTLADFAVAKTMTGDPMTHKIVFGSPPSVDPSYYTSPLIDGEHDIYVIGRDDAGNWQDISNAAFYKWTVDTTNPVASLPAVAARTSDRTLSLTVGGTNIVTYKYRLNGSAWSMETSVLVPITRSGLADASYTLEVCGRNATGAWQPDGIATTRTWVVDNQYPDASAIDFVVGNLPDNPTASTTANMRVKGNPAGSIAKIKYKLDSGAWSAAVDVAIDDGSGNLYAPIDLTGLTESDHTISVVACDDVGNWLPFENCKTFSWRVDQHSPFAIIGGLPVRDPYNSTSNTFTISGSSIVQYSYSLDGSAWSGWTAVGSLPFTGLSQGSHTLLVRGTKVSGGDSNPANTQTILDATSYTWSIDTIAPTATWTGLPADSSNPDISITVGGTGVIAYQFSIDPPTVPGDQTWWNTYGEPNISGSLVDRTVDFPLARTLAAGTHTIYVRGRDAAGNWSTPLSHTWTISIPDLVAPATIARGSFSSGYLNFDWTPPSGLGAVLIEISQDNTFQNVVSRVKLGAVGTYAYLPTSADIDTYYARVWVSRDVNASEAWGTTSPVDASWKGAGTASLAIQVVGDVTGKVIDPSAGNAAVSGVRVQIYDQKNSLYLTNEGTTNASGVFTIYNVPIRTMTGGTPYYIDFTKTLYSSNRKNNVVVARGEMTDVGVIYMLSGGSAGTITGSVVDANTAYWRKNAKIDIVNSTGTIVSTVYSASTGTETNPNDATCGRFTTASLSAGIYTAKISMAGYYDLSVDNIVVNGNKNIERQAICEILTEPQVRVILLWGATPTDLDLHLVGPTTKTITVDNSGVNPTNRFHTYWSNQKSYSEATGSHSSAADWYGTSATASLVQDDTTSYGPESMNLFKTGGVQFAKGVYTYTIHNWSYEGNSWGTASITSRIYDSGGLVREVNFPSGDPTSYARYWKMFKINIQGNSRSKRTITVVNQFDSFTYNSKSTMDW